MQIMRVFNIMIGYDHLILNYNFVPENLFHNRDLSFDDLFQNDVSNSMYKAQYFNICVLHFYLITTLK